MRAHLNNSACPRCGSAKLYWHGRGVKGGDCFTDGAKAKRFTAKIARQCWRCRERRYSFPQGLGLVYPC